MKPVFKFIDKKTILINMSEFLKAQKCINDKFPNPNRNSDRFVNDFDNMVGQIEEEIYETKESLYNNKITNEPYQTEESIEEFLDAFMYLGSLIIETAEYFNIDLDKFLKKYNLSLIYFKDTYIEDDCSSRCMLHDDFLSYVRRKIIDRKYHKPAKEKPINYEEELLASLIVGGIKPRRSSKYYEKFTIPEFIDNFNPYMQDIFFCYDNMTRYNNTEREESIEERVEYINNILKRKQNFIINL